MSIKTIKLGDSGRREMLAGLHALARTVAVTLGPRGRNVLLERHYGPPVVTKDGVSVAKEIEVSDPFGNMGVEMMKAVARKASDESGDGTTTAVILARALYAEGLRLVAAGHDPMTLKRGIDAAVSAVLEELRRQAKPVRTREQYRRVAFIASNGDEQIADLVARALAKVGLDGVITVEESRAIETELEIVEGMDFDRGYLSPAFVTNPARMQVVLPDCQIVLHPKKLAAFDEVVPILNAARANRKKSLLIVSENVEGEALQTLVMNHQRGTIRCCAVKAPGFGDLRREILEDIAVVTDATLMTEEMAIGPHRITPHHLGHARQVVVDRNNTTITGGIGSQKEVRRRISLIRSQIQSQPKVASSALDRERLEERLAKLSSGVAILHVGGMNEIEMQERKTRAENAVMATRAAAAGGIAPGGGVALLRALRCLDGLRLPPEKRIGVEIVCHALEEPAGWIARNAGHDPSVVLNRILSRDGGFGFDARTETFRDLPKSGIIDPIKVTRSSLRNAASVASTLLATETAMVEKTDVPEKDYLDPPIPERYK